MTNNFSNLIYSLERPDVIEVRRKFFKDINHIDELTSHSWTGKQDSTESALFRKWQEWSDTINLLSGFSYSYFTSGSSEAIRAVISNIRVNKFPYNGRAYNPEVCYFKGEYEGYKAFSEALGLKNREISTVDELGNHSILFISEPNSLQGNYLRDLDYTLHYIQENKPSVSVVLDFAYWGMSYNFSSLLKLTTLPDNVKAVFFSLSKPFSTYYYRIGGCFSREPIDTLYGNKWFKNMLSIELGIQLLTHIDSFYWPYEKESKEAVDALNKEIGSPTFFLSDAPIIAYSNTWTKEYGRGMNSSRVCLTPYLDKVLNYEK